VLWVKQNIYQGQAQACQKAHSLVLDQCSMCDACPVEQTTCEDPGLAVPKETAFDCAGSKVEWSDAEKTWCCKHQDKGCEFVTDAEGFKKKFDSTLGAGLLKSVDAGGASASSFTAMRSTVLALLVVLGAVVGVTLGRRSVAATSRSRPAGSYADLAYPPTAPPAASD